MIQILISIIQFLTIGDAVERRSDLSYTDKSDRLGTQRVKGGVEFGGRVQKIDFEKKKVHFCTKSALGYEEFKVVLCNLFMFLSVLQCFWQFEVSPQSS